MHIDKMLEVMQAYKAGKRIEMRSKFNDYAEWVDTTVPAPTWNFPMYDYRVKKEPLLFEVGIDNADGRIVSITKIKEGSALDRFNLYWKQNVGSVRLVRMKEVDSV